MRKNFGVKSWFYPLPVLIIGTYNEDGTPNAMNAAWGGLYDADKVVLCLSAGHKTTKNIKAKGAFTVAFADGEELIDYAAQEQDENARPELTSHIENLDQYDTIFIGYPNWWADLPMAVYSFFDEYDFSGKTIIPFNVHNGSRFSRTIQTIEELEPDATVIEDGFTVSEQTVAEAAPDVARWLAELGY